MTFHYRGIIIFNPIDKIIKFLLSQICNKSRMILQVVFFGRIEALAEDKTIKDISNKRLRKLITPPDYGHYYLIILRLFRLYIKLKATCFSSSVSSNNPRSIILSFLKENCITIFRVMNKL